MFFFNTFRDYGNVQRTRWKNVSALDNSTISSSSDFPQHLSISFSPHHRPPHPNSTIPRTSICNTPVTSGRSIQQVWGQRQRPHVHFLWLPAGRGWNSSGYLRNGWGGSVLQVLTMEENSLFVTFCIRQAEEHTSNACIPGPRAKLVTNFGLLRW